MDQKDVAKVVGVLKCLLLGGEVDLPLYGNVRLADNHDLCLRRYKYKVGAEPQEVWLGLEMSMQEFVSKVLLIPDEAFAEVTAFNVLNTKRRKP
jgi:hypothetical protein